jgi:rubrerythrin
MPQLNRDALVDKLCERLAVETAGVDIYEAVIAKMTDERLTTRLKHYMHDEAKHRDLLTAYLERMGETMHETPSARMARLEGQAYLKLVDEATTPAQLLNILLTVELMDETAWEMLVNLGRDMGEDDMVRSFDTALRDEKEHLRGVRGMLATLTRASMIEPGEESHKQ